MIKRLWFVISNRVILGAVLIFLLVAAWEFHWKAQYRPMYELAIQQYHSGNYQAGLTEIEKAYEIAPNSMDVIVMRGWFLLKLHRFEEARIYFDRALKIDPREEEAQIGSAFVVLETGRGKLNTSILSKILGRRIGDPNVRIIVAGALRQEGKLVDAAEMYRTLANDKNYGHAAQIALDEIFGTAGSGEAGGQLSQTARPDSLQVRYRAADQAMWKMSSGNWQKQYIAGINLGPGSPGHYPAAPPDDVATYDTWISDAAKANANVLRVYTLLPPSFYRAYKKYISKGGSLSLYQQIWVGDPPDRDLYDSKFVEDTKAEIRYVVDSLHGRGVIPPKHARGSGIFTADVSDHVGAILLGRELEPSVVVQTNLLNGGKTGFNGKYITVNGANATEVWLAEMLEYLVSYETDTYNWQHPVALVNWVPLDPLNHPTEATSYEEFQYRVRRGERLAKPSGPQDDNDAVSIDEAKFHPTQNLQAGFFASYHVYPYYPDFLLTDPRYLQARDAEGPNSVVGYLRDLRAHIPHPLVISEYGIPNSIGISHFHPQGFHHGGHNEAEQAQILTRLARSVRDTGCAGGIVFSLVDEWYKHNWATVDFEAPIDRAAYWLNELDPEKRYGLIGFHPSKWELFGGNDAAWEKEQTLYSDTAPKAKGDLALHIRRVQASSDEAFLYLRLKVDCLDCVGTSQRGDGKLHFDKASYAIALNTLPGQSGIQQLPLGGKILNEGANFVIVLDGQKSGRLLVAQDYYPYQVFGREGSGETEMAYRRGYTPALEHTGSFVEMVTETNRRHYGRDGTVYQPQRYSRSPLRFGSGDSSAENYDSLSEWYADPKTSTITLRVAWGKLLVTDPSSGQAWAGFNKQNLTLTSGTSQVQISALALRPRGSDYRNFEVVQTLPATAKGNLMAAPQSYTWRRWEKFKVEPYYKKAFYALQNEFRQETGAATAVAGDAAGSGGSTAAGH
jgi:tetratricopeptide (TPR) repeat protein